jgi:hypothetical protein
VSATGHGSLLTQIWNLLQHGRLSFVVKALQKATAQDKQLLRQSQSSNFLSQAIKACAAAPSKRNHQALETVIELAMDIKVDLNKPAYDGGTYSFPIIRAAYYGYVNVLKKMVVGGADLLKRESKQHVSTGVVEAAVANNQMLMLQTLLEYEIVRKELVQTHYGGLALHRAVKHGNPVAVKLLSEARARILEWSVFHCPKFCTDLSYCVATAYDIEPAAAEHWGSSIDWSFPRTFRVTARLLVGPRQQGTGQLQTHTQLPKEMWLHVLKYLGRRCFPAVTSLEQMRVVFRAPPILHT